jgi:hypothetical protein
MSSEFSNKALDMSTASLDEAADRLRKIAGDRHADESLKAVFRRLRRSLSGGQTTGSGTYGCATGGSTSLMFVALTVPARAETAYDGVWDVTIETRAGNRDAAAHYRLTVQDGKVSGPAEVAGTVAHEGFVKVSLNGAYANGQLLSKTGSGRWNASSAGKPCSGHWEATKV